MGVEWKFHDYSEEVKDALENLAFAALEEAAGELESQVKRNTTVGKVEGSDLKNNWQHRVYQKSNTIAGEVGNPLERALWIEFGTGDYALEGKGRKGGWYIPIGEGKDQISQAVVDAYHFKVVDGKNGMKYAHTYGIRPQRPFQKAYNSEKNKLIRRIQNKFKGGIP